MTRRRRVLLINNSLANGGLERQLLLLARGLPPEWEVRLWTLEGGPHEAGVAAAGIPWSSRPRRSRYDVTPALDLWRVLREWRPDVVHAWHWMPAAAALPACRTLKLPLIDGSIRMGSVPRSFGRPRRVTMRFATRVVANSQAGLDAWRVLSPHGVVIYNAFDGERLAALPQTLAPELAAEPFTAVMTARMARQKDFWTVLAAARALAQRAPAAWRFVLVGDGADRPRLTAAAADLVDAGVVEFPAGGTEVIDHVRRAHVGVLLTDPTFLAEGCSNSIMEYMACGLPVICTAGGGNGELVRAGREGLIIPPHDPLAFAAALQELREHPQLRATMGAAGRQRIALEFTVERMVEAYVRVYLEAMEGR